jgi:DNA invertase Pin-like site-specific DNA recombinase
MHFVEDTRTAVRVRQMLGAVAEFEKTTIVAKLAAARRRKRMAGKKVERAQEPCCEAARSAGEGARPQKRPRAGN